MKSKNNSSRRWLKEHFSDVYVKNAQKAGLRSRSVYKLQELHQRYRLFKSGMTVIELGAAPGGWSQWLLTVIKPNGAVIAVDLLPLVPINGVDFIQGDIADQTTQNALLEKVTLRSLSKNKVDWIISDMAPNLCGIASVDQARTMDLVENALNLAKDTRIRADGLLCKVFEGEGFLEFLANVRKVYRLVTIKKPKASRARSSEVYVLAKELKG